MDFVIGGREEAAEHLRNCNNAVTHLVGLGDHGSLPVVGYERVANRLLFNFDDISRPHAGYVMCEDADLERLIEFARALPEGARVLYHCEAGISRSTAAAFISLCARDVDPLDAMSQVITHRRIARPNERMVEIADRLLARRGRMIKMLELPRVMRDYVFGSDS